MKTPISAASKQAYDEDLAYVHDVGFGGFARKAAPGLLQILNRSGNRSGRVVDLGCGSGIWAGELVRAGYDVTGVDLSPAMIALARKRSPKAEFHVGSYRTFPLPACTAVTSLGEPLNYLFDRKQSLAQLSRLFRRVYAALEVGGVFLFDVAEPGRDQGRSPTFWEGDDWVCMTRFETNLKKQLLTRHIVTFRKVGKHYRRGEEAHRMQLYRGTELARMLRKIGFRVRLVRSYGEYQLPKALVGFVARKT
jgi:SAM-dependent methyltransferase